MRRMSPSMVSVRCVFSLTNAAACALYWFGSKVAAMNASAPATSRITAPAVIKTHFRTFMESSRVRLTTHYHARQGVSAIAGRLLPRIATELQLIESRQRISLIVLADEPPSAGAGEGD